MEKGWVVCHYAVCFALGLWATVALRSLKLYASEVHAEHGLVSFA